MARRGVAIRAYIRTAASWHVFFCAGVLLLAGRRPAPPTGAASSHVSLLRHFKRVIHFNSEVPHRTLKLGMAE